MTQDRLHAMDQGFQIENEGLERWQCHDGQNKKEEQSEREQGVAEKKGRPHRWIDERRSSL